MNQTQAVSFRASSFAIKQVQAGGSRCLAALSARVMTWLQQQCQRRALLALDERLLDDVGLTRAQALSEARRLRRLRTARTLDSVDASGRCIRLR